MEQKHYLNIIFEHNQIAKSRGAKFDWNIKKWYTTDDPKKFDDIVFDNKIITKLEGEDRNFGGNILYPDLIPSSCWFTNVRYCITSCDWERVRTYIYERVNYICECCDRDTSKFDNLRMEAHERWSYDDDKKIQKLERLIALCNECHQATHYGLAQLRNRGEEAKEHLRWARKIRHGKDDEDILSLCLNALDLYIKRNKIQWELDLSLMTDNGIELVKNVKKEDRHDISRSNAKTVKEILDKAQKEKININDYINTDILPLDTVDFPWLFENSRENKKYKKDTGKWMLFYKNSLINDAWLKAKKLYKDGHLEGVKSLKCSTSYQNPRSSDIDSKVIIFYCDDSYDEKKIMQVGDIIVRKMQYEQREYVYYKSDLQTSMGTRATGQRKNYMYRLWNPIYHDPMCDFPEEFLNLYN